MKAYSVKNNVETMGENTHILRTKCNLVNMKGGRNIQMSSSKNLRSITNTNKRYKNEEEINNRYINIGNRSVKITFSSDKKKRKEQRKKRKMRILASQKKKKGKELKNRKKLIDNLYKILDTEKEKGNIYFLPKRLKKKKKLKLKRMIILEKEVKNTIYHDLMQRCKNKENLTSSEKDAYFYLLKNKTKWKLKNHCVLFYLKKGKQICSLEERHKIKKRYFLTNYFYKNEEKDDNVIISSNGNIAKEVSSIKKIILLWNKKYVKYAKKNTKKVHNERKNTSSTCYYKKKNVQNVEYKCSEATTHGQQNKIVRYNYIKDEKGNGKNQISNCVVQEINFNTEEVINTEMENSLNSKIITEYRNKEQMKKDILKNEKILNYIVVSKIEKKIYMNEYVDHEITDELNNLVKDFLQKISKSHEKLLLLKKKRYYLGLKESYKHICINEPKLVLVAPNIEPMLNNTFNDIILKIICKCKEKNIPLVFALSKNLLGKCINKSRQSIICIVNNDSYIKECNSIINLASSLKIYK
ncbi:SECIS-binding protein 2 [Plasmodium brasilianum]|uniref:SECIS-binding protein 2, putative n=2 Tax=Plasmodium (Plasmodium) TaxID=418103 RepID=A0A1D3PBQ3_PLAMA|nr:SECIS-binding protein 2, putative [Plasmodium malariae]KAI4838989.1 SECIS-binding protein 2 [Plasmodium brasilianum]SCN12338.1 SECIS-binding protein 2, putative [Plasmodium malariae]